MKKKASDSMTFGQRLAYTRTRKGLTQKQLAKLIGVTQGSLCRWEMGERNPDVSMIRKTIKALEVSEDWFENDNNFSINNLTEIQQDIKLTKEQQQLVADNERLIGYTYHNLFKFKNSEEYEYFYGYAAIGLCNAAKIYDKNKGGKFSSFAYDNIRWAILDARNKRNRYQMLHPLSLNVSDGEKEGDEFGSIIPASDEWEQLEYKILVESVFQKVEHILTAKEKEALRSWLYGENCSELAKKLGITDASIGIRRKKIQNKCRTFFNADQIFA